MTMIEMTWLEWGLIILLSFVAGYFMGMRHERIRKAGRK